MTAIHQHGIDRGAVELPHVVGLRHPGVHLLNGGAVLVVVGVRVGGVGKGHLVVRQPLDQPTAQGGVAGDVPAQLVHLAVLGRQLVQGAPLVGQVRLGGDQGGQELGQIRALLHGRGPFPLVVARQGGRAQLGQGTLPTAQGDEAKRLLPLIDAGGQ
ncbi:hypothetical protein D3C86_1680040 [compost metagenome]